MKELTRFLGLLRVTLWVALADGCGRNGAELVIFVSPFPAAASSAHRCGSSSKEPCSSIKSAIAAIPADLPSTTHPVIYLLPGIYRGADNVGVGDPATTAYPSESVRGIEIRGGGLSADGVGGDTALTFSLSRLKLPERPNVQTAERNIRSFKERSWEALRWLLPSSALSAQRGAQAAPVAGLAHGSVSAVIDCAGTSNATRGLYLVDGRITTVSNISVINCGGGGMLISGGSGMDVVATGRSSSSCSGRSSGCGGSLGSSRSSDRTSSSRLSTVVSLRGVTVADSGSSRASGGGGITVADGASVLLENCELQRNEARDGGGLHVAAGCNVTVSGGSFNANLAERGGGAVCGEGSWLTFCGRTLMKGNTAAAAGGGIWSHGATVEADGLQLLQNVAAGEGAGCRDEGGCGGRGGGLGATGGSVFLRGGSISGNRADAQEDRDDYARGGGIYARGVTVTFDESVFEDNRAGAVTGAGGGGAAGAGGGVYLDSCVAKFVGGAVRGNEAAASSLLAQLGAYGGGVLVRGRNSKATFNSVSFDANTARNGGGGGALWAGDGADAILNSCSFTGNRALSSFSHHGAGGALAASSTTAVNITGCTFSRNLAAPEEPAAEAASFAVTPRRMSAGTSSGTRGAAAGKPKEGREGTLKAANRQCLSGEGGALLSSGAALRVSDTIFDGNRCAAGGMDTGCQGGAVSLSGRDTDRSDADEIVLFERVVFHGNAAAGADGYGAFDNGGRGGALAAKFVESVLFSECNFTMNYVDGRSSGGGSGMTSTGGAVFLFCCGAASSSSAAGRGCSVDGGDGFFSNFDPFESSHETKGGKVGNSGAPTFVGCRFYGNTAGRQASESRETPVGSSLPAAAWSGSSSGMGGAFSASGSAPVLRSCIFEGNRAFAGGSLSFSYQGMGASSPSWSLWPLAGSLWPSDKAPALGRRPTAHPADDMADVVVQKTEMAVSEASPLGLGGAIFLTSDCIGTDISNSVFADNVAVGGSGDDLSIVGSRDTPAASWSQKGGMLLAAAAAAVAGEELTARDVANATAVLTDCAFMPTDAANSSSTFLFLAAAGDVLLLRPSLQGDTRAYVSGARARHEVGLREGPTTSADVVGGSPSSHLALLGDGSSSDIGGGGSGDGGSYGGGGSISVIVMRAAGLTLGSGAAAPPPLRDLELHGGEVRLVPPLAAASSLANGLEPAALTIAGDVRLYSGSISAVTAVTQAPRAPWTQVEAAAETVVAADDADKVTGASALSLRLPGGLWLGPAHPRKTAGGTAVLADARTWAAAAAAVPQAAQTAAAATAITLTGAILSIEGSAFLSGRLTLQGPAAAVKVAAAASLQIVGDATMCGAPAQTKADAALTAAAAGEISAAANAGIFLVNEGALQLADGVRLTIEGGLVQTASGSLRLPLPAPLPPPTPGVMPSASVQSLANRPPLSVGGTVSIEGVLNVTESRPDGGGGSGVVQMHQRWAIMSFDGNSSLAVNVSSVRIGGLPGVKLVAAFGPQEENWWPTVADATARSVKTAGNAGAPGWTLVFEAVSIECEFMLHYGNVTAAGGVCQACLSNSECAWCNDIAPTTGVDGRGPGSGSASGCVPVSAAKYGGRGGGSRPSFGHCQIGDCCPRGCSGTSRCDVTTGRCRCGWFFAGASCGDVSTAGAAALAASAAALLLAIAAALQARFLRPRQRLKDLHGTLRELRQGLLDVDSVIVSDHHLYGLNSDDDGATSDGGASSKDGGGGAAGGGGGGGLQQSRQRSAVGGGGSAGSSSGGGQSTSAAAGGGGGVTRDYIEELQQDLALRDVLVPFGEVALGPRIGGGAVGAIYRATWRGAAVAVKMVRLPPSIFDATTAAQEMERLKREAYLMSRLRHPNVVLILAISFAPRPLPPSLTSDGGSTAAVATAGGASSAERLTPARLRELGFLPPEDEEERDTTSSPEMRMRGRRLRRRSSDRRRSSGSPTAAVRDAPAAAGVSGDAAADGNGGGSSSGGALCVISEFMPGGSLEDAISRGELNEVPYAVLVGIALQAARGMLYLHTHSPPICHRDLKSSNLVVGPGWQIKITDFGMSRFVPGADNGGATSGANADAGSTGGWTSPPGSSSSTSSPVRYFSFSAAPGRCGGAANGRNAPVAAAAAAATSAAPADLHMTSNVGTVAWAAPETFGGSGPARYSLKVDSYSFGVVLWELCERRRPWGHLTSRFDIMDAVAAGERPAITAGVPRPLATLMRRCWQHDPAGRPSFREIVAFLQEEADRAAATAEAAAPTPAAAGERLVKGSATLELSSGTGAGSSLRTLGVAAANSKRKTRRMSE